MDLLTLCAATNPRLIACLASTVTDEEMALAGVHSDGVRIMGAKAAFLVVRLDAIDFRLAQKVKDSMLALGADAAVEESAWAGAGKATPLVVMGTRRHFKELLKILSVEAGDAALLGEAIAQTFDYYNRTDFLLRVPSGELRLVPDRPAIMGVLNVTPDSFSDGGKYADGKAAVARGVELAAEGAWAIDVGGESTRPGSLPVDAEEEKARVLPVISALAKKASCPISVDTYRASVAEAALDAGASIVNDITALSGDPAMAALVARRGCPVVLMHMKGTPRTMQKSPFYRELMGEVAGYLRAAIDSAVAAGVNREQIIIDPGIGFGKTCGHNLQILQRLKEFASLGRPILVGPSRKAFIGKVTGAPVEKREFGTAAAVALAVAGGAHIIRAHNVAQMREAAAVAAAIARGRSGEEV
jgi:dihydropteroate synthase